jgi:alpha-tubulin suppressor-like RCC1 family protein
MLGDGSSDARYPRPVHAATATATWTAVSLDRDFPPTWHGIQQDGSQWAWGFGINGDLGFPAGLTTIATKVGTAVWRDVAAGESNACGIQADGSLWCWGNNFSGDLGVGDSQNRSVPTPVSVGSQWLHVAIAHYRSCGIQENGSIWCWGCTAGDPVCNTIPISSVAPTRLETSLRATSIAVNPSHVCFLDIDSKLWCLGRNYSGQLGTGDMMDRSLPTRVCLP